MIDRQTLSDAAFRHGVAIVLRRDDRWLAWVIELGDVDRPAYWSRAVPDQKLADMRFPILATVRALSILLRRRAEARGQCS